MNTLYEISNELEQVITEIEENGGEVNDEILSRLTVSQENLKDKLNDYYKVIQNKQNDIEQCKAEEKRIAAIRKSKEKVVEKIKNVVLDCVVLFGKCDNKGVSRIELPTVKLSTRRSTSINVDSARVESLLMYIINFVKEADRNIDLFLNPLSLEGMLGVINGMARADYEANEDNMNAPFEPYTIADVRTIYVDITRFIKLEELFNSDNFYLLKAIINSDTISVKDGTPKETYKLAIDESEEITKIPITVAHRNCNINLAIK